MMNWIPRIFTLIFIYHKVVSVYFFLHNVLGALYLSLPSLILIFLWTACIFSLFGPGIKPHLFGKKRIQYCRYFYEWHKTNFSTRNNQRIDSGLAVGDTIYMMYTLYIYNYYLILYISSKINHA